MKIETFFDIEVNKYLLEVNTCFAIQLLEIEAITYTYRSKCIFSYTYQIEAFSSKIEANTCLLLYIE